MTTKYTPGPWRLDDADHASVTDATYHAVDAGNGVHNDITNTGFSLTGFMCEADARLIAAAPDLVEALHLISIVDQGCGGSLTFQEMAESAMRQARAALTKAGL